MSYLHVPRLHFAGTFQADVSTVNNEVAHFHSDGFRDEDQLPVDDQHPRGGFNPAGSNAWRLIDCRVTSVVYRDGSRASSAAEDSLVGCFVAGSDDAVAAKMVDLDPQQQMASEIFGLNVRLTDGDTFALRGAFKSTSFADIWPRGGGLGDGLLSAVYQSTVTGIDWTVAQQLGSRLLAELADESDDADLSMKFVVDRYVMDPTSPHFTLGRIHGTIGVHYPDEPQHFVAGRHFHELPGEVGMACAVVDWDREVVSLDLGNALPTDAKGQLRDIGPLLLAYVNLSAPGVPRGEPITIGTLPDYRSPEWYRETAGVVDLPVPTGHLDAVLDNPLMLMRSPQLHTWQPLVAEHPSGEYLRADELVARLNPGESRAFELFATRFGHPLAEAEISVYHDARGLQRGDGPPVGEPVDALAFPDTLTTDDHGRATLDIQADDPGNPRDYIDGQIYGIGYALRSSDHYATRDPINVLVFDHYDVPASPTWEQDLRPIFEQYANLYPIMSRVVDMRDYDSVVEHRQILSLVFAVTDIDDPNYMPVSRDLSLAKRQTILDWLAINPPPKGTAPTRRRQVDREDRPRDAVELRWGGKTQARMWRSVPDGTRAED